MPPPTLMVALNKDTTTLQVRKLLNGTTLDLTQDGSNVTVLTVSSTPGAGLGQMNNVLIEAFGKRFLVHRQNVHERDQGGDGNWGIVHTFAVDPGDKYSGFHMVFPEGVPTLAVISSRNSNGDHAITRSIDGVNWTETLIDMGGTSIGIYGRSVVFGSSIFLNYRDNSNSIYLLSYDLATDIATAYTLANVEVTRVGARDFIVHQDNLYLLAQGGGGGGRLRFFRLDGSVFTDLGQPTTADVTEPNRCIIFSEGDDIIALSGGTSGPFALRIQNPEGTPSYSDISSTVGVSGLHTGECGFQKFLDITDPTSPQLYFWFNKGDLNDGTYDCYQWNGIATAVSLIGTGITTVSYTIPSIGDGGNDRIPAKPAARPQFDGLPASVIGGRKRFFRIYGTGTPFNMQQAHNVDSEAPDTISTLVASTIQLDDQTDVSGLVGNLGELAIEGLTPNSGDAYVVTALDGDSTLNPGALAIAVGDIVQYNGSSWIQSVANSGGFPPYKTHAELNSSTALIAPYSDGTDDGKIVSFNGSSLDGTVLTDPTNTTAQISNVTPDEGASLYSYVHDVSADSIAVGDEHSVGLDVI